MDVQETNNSQDVSYLSANQSFTVGPLNNASTNGSFMPVECKQFVFMFNGIIVLTLCILGLVGNTVSILILRMEKYSGASIILLQALAVADNLFLTFSAWILGINSGIAIISPRIQQWKTLIRPYIIAYINPSAYILQTCIAWLTVLLAVNRYVSLCRPFYSLNFCTKKKARQQVAFVYLFSIIFNFPRFFQSEVVGNTIQSTSIGKKSLFGKIYTNGLYTIIVLLIPMLILLVLNSFVIKVLRNMRRRHSSSSLGQCGRVTNEDGMSVCMIIIIIAFIIFIAPDRIIIILKLSGSELIKTWLKSNCYYVHYINNFLVVCNSSTNFLIYYFARSGFRKILLSKISVCFRTNRQPDQAGLQDMTSENVIPLVSISTK